MAAGIDADIVELRSPAQLLDCLHVLFEQPGIRRVDFYHESNPRLIRSGKVKIGDFSASGTASASVTASRKARGRDC